MLVTTFPTICNLLSSIKTPHHGKDVIDISRHPEISSALGMASKRIVKFQCEWRKELSTIEG